MMAPVLVPIPVPKLMPAPVVVLVLILVLMPMPMPVAAPVLVLMPMLVPVPTPVAALVLVRMPVLVQMPVAVAVLLPMLTALPVPVPCCGRAVLQELHRACEAASRGGHIPGGAALAWAGGYAAAVASEQSCLNEWRAMAGLESLRPASPPRYATPPAPPANGALGRGGGVGGACAGGGVRVWLVEGLGIGWVRGGA